MISELTVQSYYHPGYHYLAFIWSSSFFLNSTFVATFISLNKKLIFNKHLCVKLSKKFNTFLSINDVIVINLIYYLESYIEADPENFQNISLLFSYILRLFKVATKHMVTHGIQKYFQFHYI